MPCNYVWVLLILLHSRSLSRYLHVQRKSHVFLSLRTELAMKRTRKKLEVLQQSDDVQVTKNDSSDEEVCN